MKGKLKKKIITKNGITNSIKAEISKIKVGNRSSKSKKLACQTNTNTLNKNEK